MVTAALVQVVAMLLRGPPAVHLVAVHLHQAPMVAVCMAVLVGVLLGMVVVSATPVLLPHLAPV